MTEEIGRRLVNGVWVTNVANESSGPGGGVTEITSDDHTVTVTNPSGPTVDLSASGGASPFREYEVGFADLVWNTSDSSWVKKLATLPDGATFIGAFPFVTVAFDGVSGTALFALIEVGGVALGDAAVVGASWYVDENALYGYAFANVNVPLNDATTAITTVAQVITGADLYVAMGGDEMIPPTTGAMIVQVFGSGLT